MKGLICPHCGRPIDEHDDGVCLPKLSRRRFFALLGGVAAALAVPKRVPTGGLFDPKADVARQWTSGELGKFHPQAFTFEWPRLDLYPMPKPGDRFMIAGVNAVNPPDSRKTDRIEFRVVDPLPPLAIQDSACMVFPMVEMTKAEFRKRYPA